MQNPPKSQLFVRARALQYSRLRSAGHTKCNCALRAQTKYIGFTSFINKAYSLKTIYKLHTNLLGRRCVLRYSVLIIPFYNYKGYWRHITENVF